VTGGAFLKALFAARRIVFSACAANKQKYCANWRQESYGAHSSDHV
jgi:hypothetical protein